MAEKILIIDDDLQLLALLQTGLESKGYEVLVTNSGEQGLQQLEQNRPHLIILDVMLPEMDGWEICRRIRMISSTPIVMLTGLEAKKHVVKGLNLGADDYIVKPFDINVLLARVAAVLRRGTSDFSNEVGEKTQKFENNELVIDLANRRVKVRGEIVHLTPLEYKLLFFLVEQTGRSVSTAVVFDGVWPYDTDAGPDSVKWYIWRLRQKIEVDPYNPRYILTEHGFGYRFVL
jgi:two-component system KDP operon response regulator KdpE